MNVKKLRLVNFRNFNDLLVQFYPSLNIFIGDNAQGKTNIIESIYVLLRGTSYRTKNDQDIINWNKNESYILGEVQKKEEKFNINILFKTNNDKFSLSDSKRIQKLIKVNKNFKKTTWLAKNFNSVIFTPEDLQIVKSSPFYRRKFLDEVIISLEPIYYRHLKDYYHILFQRNKLLKGGKNKKEIIKQLVFWDDKITELGTLIIWYRVKYLQKLNQKIKFFHQIMTENKEPLKLTYQSNVLSSYTNNKEEIKETIENKLKNVIERDFNLKITTIGPHRDDYFIMNNQVNLGTYGSQGQQRTAVLSLKLAELELLKEKIEIYPPLLLDDVMSELDLKRKIFLIQLIKDRAIQTFITSINMDDFIKTEIGNNSKIVKIKNRKVEEV